MKCLFCPDEDITNDHDRGYICLKCETLYYYYQLNSEIINSWQFRTIYKGDGYWITWNKEDNSTTIRRYSSTKAGEVVINFPGSPLNPSNIKHKLPTILTFL